MYLCKLFFIEMHRIMKIQNVINKVFALLLILFVTANLCAQGYEIKVTLTTKHYDSLRLQAFDGKKDFVDLQVLPYAKTVVFKGKKSLDPGIYLLEGDTVGITEILISDSKSQQFSITEKDSVIKFINSPENEANQQYMKEMRVFDQRMYQLDVEFREMQSNNLPQYMMQPFVDSLMARAVRISEEKTAFQQSKAEQYKQYLLGSIIKSTRELPTPPREIYGNQLQMQMYVANHLYDNYAWEDERMIGTPIAVNKHKQFANILYYLDAEAGEPYLRAALKAAKANDKVYFSFFDQLEEILGATKSLYRVEGLYIVMLKDALAYDKTDKVRKTRYEAELKHLDKNLDGSILPNFNLLMSNGDTTTLYDIKSPYLLLYFQHPECPTCRQVRTKMKDYPMLNKAIEDGKIVVLTVYFEKDKKVFDNFLQTEANPKWLNSWNYDNQIEKEELFYLVTIPYMFLVDKDKRVIKKDILYNEIEDYIKSLR